MEPKETVGLIGLGLLGSALAGRFLGAGFSVAGYDIDKAAGERLRASGGTALDSARAVAERCRRVVLSLPDSPAAARVIDDIGSRLTPGHVIIDTTTGKPDEMLALGVRLAAKGVEYIDATVGGSSRVVSEGGAIVMCGGSAAAVEQCRDLFAAFAARSFHVGASGSGARMKLVLNLVLGLNRAVLAEGLAFAARYDLDPAAALEVLRAGPAYSRAMDAKGLKMVTGDFTPEARLSQHLKDVRLILDAAETCGAMTPLSHVHKQLLERAEAAGFGALDNSAVIEAFLL